MKANLSSTFQLTYISLERQTSLSCDPGPIGHTQDGKVLLQLSGSVSERRSQGTCCIDMGSRGRRRTLQYLDSTKHASRGPNIHVLDSYRAPLSLLSEIGFIFLREL